jgi:hypothetical protein
MVGIGGEIDNNPLIFSQFATTESPLKFADRAVLEGVCVPSNPAKIMRELVKRGTEVANVTRIVLMALGTPEV